MTQQPNEKGVIPMALESIEGMRLEPMQRPVFEQPVNGQEELQNLVTDPGFIGRAVEKSMAKRQAVIDRQQPNDSELRKKVESLLIQNEFSVNPDTLQVLEDAGATAAGHLAMMQAWLQHPQQAKLASCLTSLIQDEILKARIDEVKHIITLEDTGVGDSADNVSIDMLNRRLAQLNQPNTNKDVDDE